MRIFSRKNNKNTNNNSDKIQEKEDDYCIDDGEDRFQEAVKLNKQKLYEEAFKKMKEAAEDFGYVRAQLNLGNMYAIGRGTSKDLEKAAKWYKIAAIRGVDEAQYNLGVLFQQGEDVGLDYEEATRWFEMAAEQNYPDAQCALGHMYFWGHGVAVDQKQAFHWLEKAAINNIDWAKHRLGYAYLNGVGVDKDYEQAEKWYTESAEDGIALAQYELGIIYMNGFGLAQNFKKAFHWLIEVDSEHHSEPCLGYLYENGLGTEKDDEKAKQYFNAPLGDFYEVGMTYLRFENGRKKPLQALYWFKKAAENDYVDALVAIGSMYLMGLFDGEKDIVKAYKFLARAATLENVQLDLDQLEPPTNHNTKKKYKVAMEWYTKTSDDGRAIEKGFVSGLSCLGFLYYKGLGVPQNFDKAYDIFQQVLHYIDDNDSDANMCLGILHSKGLGVDQDHRKALAYFNRSAKNVNTYTYNHIGDIYRIGNGVKKDYKVAMEWYMKGSTYEDEYSQFNIGKMYFYGLGVESDRDTALVWFRKSYDKGLIEAHDFISDNFETHQCLDLNSREAVSDEKDREINDQLLATERAAREAAEAKVSQLMAQLALLNAGADKKSNKDAVPILPTGVQANSSHGIGSSVHNKGKRHLQFFHLDGAPTV